MNALSTLEKTGMLVLLPKMDRIDAMQCSRKFNEEYDKRIDWHEFAFYLDELYRKGILELAGRSFDNFSRYQLMEGK